MLRVAFLTENRVESFLLLRDKRILNQSMKRPKRIQLLSEAYLGEWQDSGKRT
jgi:hypothetical protein